MRVYFYATLLCLGLSTWTMAQDVLYLADQTHVEGKLISLSHERISVDVKKGESTVKFTYGADRVLVIVNRRGRFVCLDQLWYMPADKRTRFIDQFMSGKEPLTHDMLIRNRPAEVIYGTIKSNQGTTITYTTLKGKSVSMPKSELIGVFYKNGKHELFAEAAVLCDKIDQLGGALPPAVASAPAAAKPKETPPPVVERQAPKPAPAPEPPKPAPVASAGAVLKLTDAQYEEYRQQALQRVEEFGVLLGVVADKATETSQKDKAIGQILSMFKPGSTIQISSAIRGGAPTNLKMRDYLIRLKLLPYKSVVLEWTDIQYVQELTQKDDGNYYGKIKGEQRFSGLNQTGSVQYSDITEKDVDVMLTPYKKQTEGEDLRKWAVLLGNVGVVATQ
ncbi:hypothetical protein [Fibrella arboris]|uniref:hypothetical protein n=1 Tax=Fibrella arboris TaxID=3242486 RepID=UPI0035203DD2